MFYIFLFLNSIIIVYMSIREFVAHLSDKRKSAKNTELNQLYKKPVPEKTEQMPITQVFNKNVYHQADILYMPKDNGFKYALVVVDLYDGTLDAEPLKVRDNATIIKTFQIIYSRKYLNYPIIITLDQGTEFKGNTKQFFNKKKTNVKYALTGRHRQLATVERANQKIATVLFKRMANQELITGTQDKQWVKDLPVLIEVLNEQKKKPINKEISEDPIADEFTGNLYKIGQKVRMLLDFPINNVDNKRLNGTFRSSDIRWSPKVYKITEVLLKPGFPPMYLTDANDNVARTKNQLSKVEGNEKEPDAKFLRGNPEYYIIQEILEKRVKNRKTEYKVRWKGFKKDDATWVSGKELDRTKDLKELKRKFNKEH